MITIRVGAAAVAVSICVAAAAVEGLAAGGSFRQRLAELRMPRLSPSLPVWIGVGIGYYVIAAIVLYRVLALSPGMPRSATLVLIAGILGLNALWNYFFFRRRSPRSSFLLGIPYSALALVLCLVLFRLDRFAGLAFLPYALYLFYANAWTYAVWRLNDRTST
ncbi:MAG: tryptophan-rich sensory protein [Longimicrobiales bacterium]